MLPRHWLPGFALALGLLLGPANRMLAADHPPSGTVTIDETQIALLYSGQIGGGTLNTQGKDYSFKIAGLGVGGVGISEIRAVGEVYDLNNLADFAGAYGEARTGWAMGIRGNGELWLQNPAGVVLHLKTEREGLMLTLGASAIVITWQ